MIPDCTRSSPLPLGLKAVHAALYGRVSRLTAVVALGTHLAMSEDALAQHLGYAEDGLEATYPGLTVLNHEWWKPETFVTLGTISAERVNELSGGLLSVAAEVALNRAVIDHDVALVIGPVFPHEVVGFSGGNKYFFPGIAGQEIIDLCGTGQQVATRARGAACPWGGLPVGRSVSPFAHRVNGFTP